MRTRPIALTAVLLGIALVIGVIEHSLPPLIPMLPLVRLGLSNIVVLYATLALSRRSGFVIAFLKSIIVPLFLGNPIMALYSLAGSAAAYACTLILLELRLSVVVISAFAALAHAAGQITVAAIAGGSASVYAVLPLFALISTVTGVFTGLVVLLLIKKLPLKYTK